VGQSRTFGTRLTADPFGQWSLYLAPGPAGGPFDLAITAANTIAFKDVLVGDVWVASGQSNMEFKLRQTASAQAEIAAAKYPKIRRILIPKRVSDHPMDDTAAQPWKDINPDNAANASAVAFFFARNLQDKLNGVPMGIVESFWGGTPVESWWKPGTSTVWTSGPPPLKPLRRAPPRSPNPANPKPALAAPTRPQACTTA
jgi:sialate O-acetylesterase